jgi:hypothetical protein
MPEDEEGELQAALVDISGHIDHPIYERKDLIVKQMYTHNDAAPVSNWSCHMKKYMATKTIFNVKDLDDENYSADMGADPLLPWFWGIGFYQPYIDSSHNILVYLMVNITYYVTLSEPIGAAISGSV